MITKKELIICLEIDPTSCKLSHKVVLINNIKINSNSSSSSNGISSNNENRLYI